MSNEKITPFVGFAAGLTGSSVEGGVLYGATNEGTSYYAKVESGATQPGATCNEDRTVCVGIDKLDSFGYVAAGVGVQFLDRSGGVFSAGALRGAFAEALARDGGATVAFGLISRVGNSELRGGVSLTRDDDIREEYAKNGIDRDLQANVTVGLRYMF
ncbi:MAG: hypothetical protein AAB426_09205 [Myxococcota bacterium]